MSELCVPFNFVMVLLLLVGFFSFVLGLKAGEAPSD